MSSFGLLAGAIVIWSEYIHPRSPLHITQQPAWTLLVATLVCLVVNVIVRHPLPRAGVRFAVRNAIETSAIMYVVAVMFGAPLISIDAFAWCVYLGFSFALYEQSATRHLGGTMPPLTPFTLSLVFSWVGCFVIPLDWDRPYQPFPIGSSLLCSLLAPPTMLMLRSLGVMK
jgi:hypothetical protein